MLKNFQKALVAAAAAVFCVLLWRLDINAVGSLFLGAGWGIVLILPLEGMCHVFNATAWRFCFPESQARHFGFRELWRLRLVGDALNYLTPSATIGGEVARATMLHHAETAEARASSVVAAKFAQTLAQAGFVLSGFIFVASAYLPPGPRLAWLRLGASWLLTLAASAFAVYSIWGRHWIATFDIEEFAEKNLWGFGKVPYHLRMYFRHHPGRMGAAILFFFAAYPWSAVEAYWICRLIGLNATPRLALAIETLSIGIDALLFVVPAKIGTQEGAKTAVFALLGLPPASGFAFGLIRHVRELAWAFAGMAVLGLTPGLAAWRRSRGFDRMEPR